PDVGRGALIITEVGNGIHSPRSHHQRRSRGGDAAPQAQTGWYYLWDYLESCRHLRASEPARCSGCGHRGRKQSRGWRACAWLALARRRRTSTISPLIYEPPDRAGQARSQALTRRWAPATFPETGTEVKNVAVLEVDAALGDCREHCSRK